MKNLEVSLPNSNDDRRKEGRRSGMDDRRADLPQRGGGVAFLVGTICGTLIGVVVGAVLF